MTHASSGYLAFLANWLVGMRTLQLEEYVVIADDGAAWDFMRRLGLERKAIHFGFDSSSSSSSSRSSLSSSRSSRSSSNTGNAWYDTRYREMMGVQPRRILSVFASGSFDLLVTDADVVWRRSPWPALEAPSRRHCEVQAMAGGRPSPTSTGSGTAGHPSWDAAVTVSQPYPQANCATCLNAGFLYLRRGPRSAALLGRWVHQLSVRHEQDTNQKWLNWALSSRGASTASTATMRASSKANATPARGWRQGLMAPTACQLDPAAFANGAALQAHLPLFPRSATRCGCEPRDLHCKARARSVSVALVAAHLNYSPSAGAKLCTAKELGLWLISNRTIDRAGFVGPVDGGLVAAPGGGLAALSARLAAARAAFWDRVDFSEPGGPERDRQVSHAAK